MEKGFKKNKVLLLSLGHLITDIYPGFLAPLLPLLMIKLNFSIAGAAVLNSTLILATSLLQPIFGYLSDRIIRKIFVVAGPIMSAFFLSGINIPNDYFLLLLFIILGGLGVAAFHPQAAALTNVKSGHRKDFGMGIFVFGGSVGFSLGSLLISGIVSLGGLENTHYAMIFGFIISFLLYKNFFNVEIPKIKNNNNNYSEKSASFILVLLIIIVFIRSLIILGLSTFIPIYLAEKGENVAYGGITLFLMHSSGALGGLFGGHISEKIGIKAITLISFIIPIPLFVLYLLTDGFISLLLITIGSFVLFSSLPVTISISQNIFPHRVSMVSSLTMGLCWGLAGLVFMGVGAIAETIGVKTTMFYLVFTTGIGFLMSLFLPRFNTNNAE